jgi:hypothetical protein
VVVSVLRGAFARLLDTLRGVERLDLSAEPSPDEFDDPVLLARTPGAERYHAPRPGGERPRCGGSTPRYRLVERADAASDHDPCGNPACRSALFAED